MPTFDSFKALCPNEYGLPFCVYRSDGRPADITDAYVEGLTSAQAVKLVWLLRYDTVATYTWSDPEPSPFETRSTSGTIAPRERICGKSSVSEGSGLTEAEISGIVGTESETNSGDSMLWVGEGEDYGDETYEVWDGVTAFPYGFSTDNLVFEWYVEPITLRLTHLWYDTSDDSWGAAFSGEMDAQWLVWFYDGAEWQIDTDQSGEINIAPEGITGITGDHGLSITIPDVGPLTNALQYRNLDPALDSADFRISDITIDDSDPYENP